MNKLTNIQRYRQTVNAHIIHKNDILKLNFSETPVASTVNIFEEFLLNTTEIIYKDKRLKITGAGRTIKDAFSAALLYMIEEEDLNEDCARSTLQSHIENGIMDFFTVKCCKRHFKILCL